jgi:Acyl-CoA carboxylase epsilon subunit
VTGQDDEATSGRVLWIVRGDPDCTELAAVTALVTAGSAAPTRVATTSAARAPSLRGRWNDPSYGHRRWLQPGPGRWSAAVRDR